MQATINNKSSYMIVYCYFDFRFLFYKHDQPYENETMESKFKQTIYSSENVLQNMIATFVKLIWKHETVKIK